MEARSYNLHGGKKGAALAIRVTPRSSRNEITEIMNDGTIKVRLTASAGEAKVNDALIDYLAQILEVPKSKIEVVAGATGKDKLVSILDLSSETVHERILRNLS